MVITVLYNSDLIQLLPVPSFVCGEFIYSSCLSTTHYRWGTEPARCIIRNPGRDISFPIFTRKKVEIKRIGKGIKTIISCLNDLSLFLSNIEQNRN